MGGDHIQPCSTAIARNEHVAKPIMIGATRVPLSSPFSVVPGGPLAICGLSGGPVVTIAVQEVRPPNVNWPAYGRASSAFSVGR